MITKKYTKKDGTISVYHYDSKKHNAKKNKRIYNLQRMKSYYKRQGNLEKVESIQLLINVAKRKLEMEKKEEN